VGHSLGERSSSAATDSGGNHVKQHLWNAKHFTREMEKAYEEMWQGMLKPVMLHGLQLWNLWNDILEEINEVLAAE